MIDKTNQHILSILQEDCRLSNAEISRRVGVTAPAIYERIKKMRHEGIIEGFEVRINPKAVGLHVMAFTFIALHEMKQTITVAQQLTRIPHIQEIHNVIGEDGLLVKIRCADTAELGKLLEDVNFIEGVRSTKSTIVFNSYKDTLSFPLNQDESDDS